MNPTEATHGEEEETGSATGGPPQEQSGCSPDPKGGRNLDARGLTDPAAEDDRNRDSVGEAREDAGFVYLVGVLDGCHKIGRSINPDGRLASYAPLLPNRLQVVHSIQAHDAVWLEAILHSAFAECRIGGEWFKLDEQSIETIKSIGPVAGAASLPLAILLKHAEPKRPKLSSSRQPRTARASSLSGNVLGPTIGEIVRNLRESMGLSREQLAESSGLSKGYLADLEQDRFESVTTDTLKSLRGAMPKLECQQILDASPPSKKPVRPRGRPPAPTKPGKRKRG